MLARKASHVLLYDLQKIDFNCVGIILFISHSIANLSPAK